MIKKSGISAEALLICIVFTMLGSALLFWEVATYGPKTKIAIILLTSPSAFLGTFCFFRWLLLLIDRNYIND